MAKVSDQDAQCTNLEGMYEFVGDTLPDSRQQPMGLLTNIATVLYPNSQVAFDDRISHYRLLLENGTYQLEMRTPHGILKRLLIAGERDFLYCLDGVLTIERQKRERIGSVYRYSRYRHQVRKMPDGELEVDTDVTGKYRNDFSSWEQTPEHYAVRFAPMNLAP
jgi:hypothetical protein